MSCVLLMDNRLRIESSIASGGSGIVYKAWHTGLRKHVVVKELFESFTGHCAAAQRNEAEALKNVKNQYLPQLYDFILEGGRALTVMEYIEGDNFESLLICGSTFSHADVIKWYGQLACALKALHEQNICHRDIKPANVMLLPCGDVCLIDLNSALVTGNTMRILSRSPGYASPEHNKAFDMQKGVLDWKLADIYSLGATMYHILTGNRPHERADSVVAISKFIRQNTGIAHVIERSMKPEPSERFSSAAALADAVHHVQRHVRKRDNFIGTSLTPRKALIYGSIISLAAVTATTVAMKTGMDG